MPTPAAQDSRCPPTYAAVWVPPLEVLERLQRAVNAHRPPIREPHLAQHPVDPLPGTGIQGVRRSLDAISAKGAQGDHTGERGGEPSTIPGRQGLAATLLAGLEGVESEVDGSTQARSLVQVDVHPQIPAHQPFLSLPLDGIDARDRGGETQAQEESGAALRKGSSREAESVRNRIRCLTLAGLRLRSLLGRHRGDGKRKWDRGRGPDPTHKAQEDRDHDPVPAQLPLHLPRSRTVTVRTVTETQWARGSGRS